MQWQKGRGSKPTEVNKLSEPKTAMALIKTGVCSFAGLFLKTDNLNDITVNLYDNVEASGNARCCPNDTLIRGIAELFTLTYDPPIQGKTGIYVEISVAGGGSCSYQVVYDE